jgi:class 3 adenylate cyclase
MKRSLSTTIIIGVAVALVVSLLHATKVMLGLENTLGGLVSHYATSTRVVGEKWHYVFVLVLALGVAWLSLTSVRQNRARLLVGLLLIELLGLSWVCSLYRVYFQPLPSIFAVVLGLAAAEGWIAFSRRDRSHLTPAFFAGHLSKKELSRLQERTISVDAQPKTYEVSVMACDVANKYALAEDSELTVFAQTVEAFIRHATDHLLQAGAYLQAADGEGVVAIFGFPASTTGHAEKAVRVALNLVEDFRKRRQNNGELPENCDVQVGISSGGIVAAPLKDSRKPRLLTSGEPIELARRFCAANNFYGSNVLIGTSTFDLASQIIVARPIDFVKGVDGQERHEVYEPLWLATEAKAEHIARRDCFWAGVVLYREKRWAEAYTEFQKARGSDEENDPPLQFYLRRVEPLALHLIEAPPD